MASAFDTKTPDSVTHSSWRRRMRPGQLGPIVPTNQPPSRVQDVRPIAQAPRQQQSTPRAVAPPPVDSSALTNARARIQRSQQGREQQVARFKKEIRKTGLMILGAALMVAIVADICDAIDLGWVIAWTLPIISWNLIRRISSINKGGDHITQAIEAAQRTLRITQQRLRPALLQSGNGKLLVNDAIGSVAWKGKSYVGRYLRNFVITYILELIPILDWLPMYTGGVVKVIIDQNIAYQKVRALIPELQRVNERIDRLEQFEMNILLLQEEVTANAPENNTPPEEEAPPQESISPQVRAQLQDVSSPSPALRYAA